MLFDGMIAEPETLAVMEEAFEASCRASNLVDESEREYLAHLIIRMFEDGARTFEDFMTGLDSARAA